MNTDGDRFLFYAMRRGRVPGVYQSWQECDQQMNGYQNSKHRGFRDLAEALTWLHSATAPPTHQPTPPVQPVRKRSSRLLGGAFYSILSSQQVSSGVVPSNNQQCGGRSNPVVQGEINPKDDDGLFGFMVVLSHNGRGLDLMAHGYTICDYNHHILVRVKEYRIVSDDVVGVLVGVLVRKKVKMDPTRIQFFFGFPPGLIK
ncbi:hypothetical protein Ahy_A01g003705 [Arachis hypogaea]|uniref:Ribonuclease H n=1 Tax=Arachis hypogaea TaxID=3818 RepID=A0A445ETN0_ARAHY|nr:hypothetical protein Ahy_A01g003705 [Arachis hypogaea]